MVTTFQLSAFDLYDADASWDEDLLEHREAADLRLCSVSNCDDLADHGDEFCSRCRDEIDAVREMPRRRAHRP
jgi:hypothetical protein